MIFAIIILSTTVLLLLVTIIFLSAKCIDLNSSFNCIAESLREKEENFSRAQNLVMDKFNFHLPSSRLFLEIVERDLRKEQSND